MEKFILEIKLQRAKKGWNQDDLAKASGVSSCTIGLIESGKQKPSINTIVKIARALEVEPEKLIEYLK